ncbi:MAG: hydrolase [Dethiobacter sp.]|jgi:nicotinamidase-related amidase|nr:hydrolase [Dethiobacter sp.]
MEKFLPNQENSALLIIDVQERLAAAMKVMVKAAVIKNCLHLIELSKMLNIPVILTEQYPKGLGPTVAEIKDALPEYLPLEKLAFNCCHESKFTYELKKLRKKNILLAGMETHICVLQTCLGLLQDDYNVHLASDAVCSRTKENWVTGVEFMRDAGAVITSTETFMFQLLNVAGTEQFKAMSKRIK